jgi:hypothetical protein
MDIKECKGLYIPHYRHCNKFWELVDKNQKNWKYARKVFVKNKEVVC